MPIAVPDVKEKKANPKGFSKPPAKKVTKPKTVPVKTQLVPKPIAAPIEQNNVEATVKIEHVVPRHVVPPWEDEPVKQAVQQERKPIKFDDMLKAMQQPAPEIPSFMKR
jgi:hypothetical protein